MAIIDSFKITENTTATHTITFENIIGDLLVVQQTATRSRVFVSATAGWTNPDGIVTPPTNLQKSSTWWKVATSANETFSITYNSTLVGSLGGYTIKEFDTLNPIETTVSTIFDAASSMSSPTITGLTNEDNLALYCFGQESASEEAIIVPVGGAQLVGAFSLLASRNSYIYAHSKGKTDIPEVSFRTNTVISGVIQAIVINDVGTKNLPKSITNIAEYINPEGKIGDLQYPVSGFTSLADIVPTTIDGEIVNTGTPTTIVTGLFSNTVSIGTKTSITHLTATNGGPSWISGLTYLLDAPTDFTSGLLSFTSENSTVPTRLDRLSGMIYLEDSLGNWAAYQHTNNEAQYEDYYTVFMDLAILTPVDESATSPDLTDITRIAWMAHLLPRSSSSVVFSRIALSLVKTPTFTGGTISDPFIVSDVRELFNITGVAGYPRISGVGQSIFQIPIQIGDGSTKTVFKGGFSSLETPLDPEPFTVYLTDPTNQRWLAGALSASIRINASADDIIDFGKTVLAANQEQIFIIDASSSASADYSFGGALFRNYRVTSRSFVNFTSSFFDSCYTITLNGGILNNSTISNSIESSALITSNPTNVTNNVFESGGSGHAIELTAIGSFNFSGNTFTGYGADGTTDAEIYNNSGGLITLNLPAGSLSPTVRNGVGASTVISVISAKQKVTLTGGLANSRVQIYDLTSDTELANEVVVSFPYGWEDTLDYVADRQIRLRVMEFNNTTASLFIDQIIGTSTNAEPAISFLINQEPDVVYANNAVDGATITTIVIDDLGLLVNVDTGSITWAQIYAYETYWLYTEIGIRDEGRFITAIDSANYILYDFKIKNITSPEVALMITGGWGRDSVTDTTSGLIDFTGGPIFSNPDIVISYAIGSGLSAAQDAKLSAIETKLQADARQVALIDEHNVTQAELVEIKKNTKLIPAAL